MRWVDALKEWNAKRDGKYLIPKKDTAEYLEVKALMGTAAPAESSARKPRSMSPKARSESPKPRTAARPMPGLRVPIVAAEVATSKPAPRRKASAAASAGAGASGEMFIQEAIAKMKKGALTAQAKKHGKEPLEFAADVLADPKSYTETTRKRAQFLMNIQKKTS